EGGGVPPNLVQRQAGAGPACRRRRGAGAARSAARTRRRCRGAFFRLISEAVLEFWFGPRGARGKARPEWFRKDEKFDAEIRRRFGELHASAALRELEAWRASPEPLLALVLVLDQFSRNLYRGDARAFAQD